MLNFSSYTIELNEKEPGIAPTDSRLRPDQRLLEELKLDEANEVKVHYLLVITVLLLLHYYFYIAC